MLDSDNPKLCDIFDSMKLGLFEGFFQGRVSEDVVRNLNPKFPLREYQKEALGRFSYYRNGYPKRIQPTNLLFNMATGSGKTLLMAANILQLYLEGYRNFMFFVNSTNIIEKTRENFLNSNSSKYLFAQSIRIDRRIVRIREVRNFDEANKDDINIIFTTIQGLHSQLTLPRENAVTEEDFEGRKIVMISDETHHLNALTKLRSRMGITTSDVIEDVVAGFDVEGLNKEEEFALRSWEGTVKRIFLRNSENVLLEYTATIDLAHSGILAKYQDKIIYQYDLRKFREDRFSKEIEVLEADLAPLDRALWAVILSQYRKKIALRNGVNLKPVVLFKANRVTIPKRRKTEDVVSSEFQKIFLNKIASLSGKDLRAIKERVAGNTILGRAFKFFDESGIALENLAEELRIDFGPERCLTVNDESEANKWQVVVNSLEDEENQIRAVFAVEKLDEGWDVLNLFDIVRLYNTRDARANRPGKTTMREAQLIGRGARYSPFQINSEDERDRRKYDREPENDLRILEQLHYHSAYNPKYIQELHQALVETGIMPKETRGCEIKIKTKFAKTQLWKNGKIYLNERKKNDRLRITGFTKRMRQKPLKANLLTGESIEKEIFGVLTKGEIEKTTVVRSFGTFHFAVVRKALDRNPFFSFSSLKEYFPNLHSLREFISGREYLPSMEIEITGLKFHLKNLASSQEINILSQATEELSEEIKKEWAEYIGTKEFLPMKVRECFVDRKILNIAVDEYSDQERGIPMSRTTNQELFLNLNDKDWYVYDENYGTSEEKRLIRFIGAMMTRLHEKYTDIYLLRNEKPFRIHRFSDGAAIEPDFLLFMTEKNSGEENIYQVFVEAKGKQFAETDRWKEEFLLEIEKNYKIQELAEDMNYRIFGLPFFTSTDNKPFRNAFEDKILKK